MLDHILGDVYEHSKNQKTKFKRLQHHFVGNVDETCILSLEGNLYVVGVMKTNKWEKIWRMLGIY